MRPRITYANAMATMALFLAIGGTAIAAVTLTGRNVADRSITSADVKSQSLGLVDLTPATKARFVGDKGAAGRVGSAGSSGTTGVDGERGRRGSAAFMTSAFAYRDTGLVTNRQNVSTPNNNGGPGKNWDDPAYASTACPGSTCPQIRAEGAYQQVNLTSAWQPIVSLTGMSGTDTSLSAPTLLKLTFSEAYLNATASLTFLHRGDGESLATNDGGAPIHGRVECALFYGTSGDPNALTAQAGVLAQASAGYDSLNHELINISLNGNAAGLAAGTQYNATVKCRDADYTGNPSPQWQLARGNLTALASR